MMKTKILIALALSAMASLIYEVTIMEKLFFYFVESSYSTSTVLAVFLGGLGIGSFIVGKIKIEDKVKAFHFLQVIVILYAIIFLVDIDKFITTLLPLGTFTTAFLLLIIPTMVFGAIFPLSAMIYSKESKDTSLVYTSDLIGAVLGSLLAGFVLIPILGLKVTILCAIAINCLAAITMGKGFIKYLSIFFLLLTAVLLFLNMQHIEHTPTEFGEVWVEEGRLFIDGRDQCAWWYPENASEKMMVDYALEANPKAENALNIGLGCGLTAQRALDNGLHTTVIEINPEIVELNKNYTDVLEKENIELFLDDGMNYMRFSKSKYDVVLIDVENPEIVHSSNMYTVEAFGLAKKRLNENGALSLWAFDLYYANTDFHDIMYWTLKEQFDYVYKYPDVFIATDFPMGIQEYEPSTKKQINSIDHKIIKRW